VQANVDIENTPYQQYDYADFYFNDESDEGSRT